jgi:hypothetical protein
MGALAVVKHFDELEDFGSCCHSRLEHPLVNEFELQRSKEAFCYRIVSAVAPAGHAGRDLNISQSLLIDVPGIGSALVAVMDQAWRWFALCNGHV